MFCIRLALRFNKKTDTKDTDFFILYPAMSCISATLYKHWIQRIQNILKVYILIIGTCIGGYVLPNQEI